MQIIVHGGAISPTKGRDTRQQTLERAARSGAGCSDPVAAVVQAISILEHDPAFNAGIGGAVQSDGVIRTDAGIMTSDRSAGAACSMAGVVDAIAVARSVMSDTPHVLLAGDRAEAYAESVGIDVGVDLWTDRTRDRWNATDRPGPAIDQQLTWVRESFGGTDTVGAVAVDAGRIAVGTSTGGRWGALAGRVGDVPQIGAGFFCGPMGGASTTGHGEAIATTTLARQAVDGLKGGDHPTAIAERTIEHFLTETGATAGLILADRSGRLGWAATADSMQIATADH